MRQRILNLTVRLLTGGLRLLFIIFIGKNLLIDELALYGLLAATASLVTIFMGAELHNNTNREVIKSNDEQKFQYIINQAIAVIPSIFITLIALSLYVYFYKLELFTFLFFLLVLFEYLSQEISRILIALERQVISSLLLFLRTALWIPIVFVDYSIKGSITLDTIVVYWTTFCFISIIFGSAYIRLGLNSHYNYVIETPKWFLQTYRSGVYFFVSAICMRGIVTIDKLLLQEYFDIDFFASYVFYFSLANIPISLAIPLIFSYFYPKLIKNVKIQKIYNNAVKEAYIISFSLISLFFVASYFMLPILLDYIGKPEFLDFQYVYYLLLIGTSFNLISKIPHYEIYAHQKDSYLMKINCIGFVIFLLLLTLSIVMENEVWAVLSFGVTFLLIFLIKYTVSRRSDV
jgi:O-antigen/teichoic acid export membrane protein